ncbi:MAG: hypothetical protein LUO93_03780 [Methanomicrobiales archaeon]|nr:hypothetical protein [Methanomicrobiales archaeon]
MATLVLQIAPRTREERAIAHRIVLRTAIVFAVLLFILFFLSLIIA